MSPHKWVRFGVFEVDLDANEIRKHGVKLKLQPQPFQILAALLEHPGEVVSREQLSSRLWPAGTFVDFDASLASGVNKVRELLGDSATTPRFIETVPRKGYRFIAPLDNLLKAAAVETLRADENHLMLRSVDPAAPRDGRLTNQIIAVSVALLIFLLAALAAVTGQWSPANVSIDETVQLTNDGRPKDPVIATDEARIYMSELVDGRLRLADVAAEGGQTHLITTSLDQSYSWIYLLDLSRDGSALLVDAQRPDGSRRGGSGLWRVAVPGGSAKRIAGVSCARARWSPDGRRIACIVTDNRTDLVLVDSLTGVIRPVRKFPGGMHWVEWSPDGHHIQVSAQGEPGAPIRFWEMDEDGRQLRMPLPVWRHAQTVPVLLPGGRAVAASLSDGNLWFVNGADARPLTSGPLKFWPPVAANTGRRLIAMGQMRRGELLRYDRQTRQFKRFAGGISAECATVSRDGAWIAYTTYPEGELWRSKLDGSSRLQLTGRPLQAYRPQWSPDGKRLAYIARTADGPWRIWVVDADGGHSKEAGGGPGPQADPSWSPDGRRLAFAPFPWDVTREQQRIQILDPGSGKVEEIPGSAGMFSPAWSPDGRRLVAVDVNEVWQLKLYDFESRTWSKFLPMFGGFPTWSADSAYVYWITVQGVSRTPVATRKSELVAAFGEFPITGTSVTRGDPHAFWMGLGPDDSPLVLRDTGSEDIYALEIGSGASRY